MILSYGLACAVSAPACPYPMPSPPAVIWLRLGLWLAVRLVVCFGGSGTHSKLAVAPRSA